MPRVAIKTKHDLPKPLWPLWERMQSYGSFENQAGAMAHRPPIFKNVWALLTDLADEAVLPDPIRGNAGFAERFAVLGPRDSQGRLKSAKVKIALLR